MSEANKKLAAEWFEQVWNQKSESAIERMFHSDRRSHGLPDPDSVLVGAEAFKAFHRQFCGAFPDLHVDVEDVIAEGDRVAVRWKASGTHRGDHLGIPATGRAVAVNGSSFFAISGGSIEEVWNQSNARSSIAGLKTP